MNVMNFTASSAEFIEKTNNELFRKMRIKAFASGENAHTLPVDESILKSCAYSVYDKPIVWKYNRFFDDAMAHEPEEIPVGFVKESDTNPVIFEQGEDGRIFMTIEALIWTKYCGRLIEIFERDGGHKDVSIEINTLSKDIDYCNKPLIEQFCVAGITILGEMYNPAVKGCKATLLEFSQDKDEYLKTFSLENSLGIDNSKESSVTGNWENPRRKLFVPISKADNSVALLKESYLIGDFSTKTPEITKFKYPHHIVKDGKLVLHKEGLISAFQKASQQGIVNGQVKSHLVKHYKELGLSQENFAEFAMSSDDFDIYFKDNNFKTESGCNINMADETKEIEVENSTETEVVVENSTEAEVVVENSAEVETEVENSTDTEVECSTETEVEVENSTEDISEEKTEEIDNAVCTKEDCTECSDETTGTNNVVADCEHDCEMSIEEAKNKISELEGKIVELETTSNAYMAKIEAMGDYDALKQFKADTEERMAREAEMSQMETVMSEISEKGFSFSEQDKKALMEDFKNFSSIDAWKNYVKAQVFDKADNSGIVRMGLADNTSQNTGSIWDRI